MKKNVIALAVAAAMAAPLAAQAAPTVYGKLHASVDSQSSDYDAKYYADSGKAYSNSKDTGTNVVSRASRIGVKGSEDLGGGLKAIYQVEFQVDIADNSGANNMKARNQFVGLGGGFGTVVLGRHDTPYKMSTGKLDVFSDTAADYNAIVGSPVGLENRGDNVIAYLSPNFNGFSVQAAVVAAENEKQDFAATSIAATYSAGPLYVAVAQETFADSYDLTSTTGSTTKTNKGQSGTRAGVGYAFGNMGKVGLVYETANVKADNSSATKDEDTYTATLVNGAFNIGGGNTIIAEYGEGVLNKDAAGADDKKTTLAAVGVSHGFSKNTSAYVAYGNVGVDQGNQDVKSTGGEWGTMNTSIFTLGMVTKF